MTDTTTTPKSSVDRPSTRPVTAPPRLRRRPAVAGLGIALVALGGLAAGWLATSMDDSTPVVVAAREVYRGQVIGPEDLAVANISGLSPAAVLPGDQVDAVVGQTATTDLQAGVPVAPGSVSTETVPGPGESVVGILLAPGQLPTVELRPGDRVRIVATPRTQDDAPTSVAPGASAVVAGTSLDETSGHTVVNVVLPAPQAPEVAALAATGRAALILDNAAAVG